MKKDKLSVTKNFAYSVLATGVLFLLAHGLGMFDGLEKNTISSLAYLAIFSQMLGMSVKNINDKEKNFGSD